MKAWRVERTGGIEALSLCEVATPAPGPGEVLVEVHAGGLNFSDLLMAAGRYQVQPPLPFVPGQEISGRIAAIGPGSSRRIGERIATKVVWGGFAAFALAKEGMLIAIPDSMPFGAAATLPVVWPTAWIALFDRARLAAGETVLVHAAAGGVGLAAVQLARATGAKVIAGVGDQDKAALAQAAGAEHVVLTRNEGWQSQVTALTDGRGPQVIFDAVGGEIADASLKVLARKGRFLIVGFASGQIPKLAANRLLLKNASALGVYWSHELDGPLVARSVSEVLALWSAGKVRIEASHVYPLDSLKAALADLEGRRTTGKCVLEVKEET